MRIDVITCLPGLIKDSLNHSITHRAQKSNTLDLQIHDLRQYSASVNNSIDDYVYGGGAGMILTIDPIVKCIEHIQSQTNCNDVIYMAPDGELLSQKIANHLSTKENLIILCGHYKGIDERVRTHFITKEISIGNYVLSGGELPAIILIDSITRLIPGVISDTTSALTDSFQDNLIAPPVYSRPAIFRELKVPDVLLSGDQKKIETWRDEESIKRTKERRPELMIPENY